MYIDYTDNVLVMDDTTRVAAPEGWTFCDISAPYPNERYFSVAVIEDVLEGGDWHDPFTASEGTNPSDYRRDNIIVLPTQEKILAAVGAEPVNDAPFEGVEFDCGPDCVCEPLTEDAYAQARADMPEKVAELPVFEVEIGFTYRIFGYEVTTDELETLRDCINLVLSA